MRIIKKHEWWVFSGENHHFSSVRMRKKHEILAFSRVRLTPARERITLALKNHGFSGYRMHKNRCKTLTKAFKYGYSCKIAFQKRMGKQQKARS